MSIGENLKLIRKRKGLTQGQLAELSGIQLTQVSRLENDDTDPKASTLFKLMKALGCSAEELMHGEASENEPAYVQRVVKKIEELTPLRKFVLLDMIQSYCKQNTVDESNLAMSGNGDYGYEKFEMYGEAMRNDQKIIDQLSAEIDETVGQYP